MNSDLLAALGRERRATLRDEFAKGPMVVPALRPFVARALRASGDRLFRLGVALDERVSCAAAAETRVL
jgi:hypothetical protein